MDILKVKVQVSTAQISSKDSWKVFGPCKRMYLGKPHNTACYRMLMKLPLSMIPSQCMILKAELKIYVQAAGIYGCSWFKSFVIAQDWSIDAVTWDNQPQFYLDPLGESIYIKETGFYTFNITQTVQQWHEKDIPNYGLLLMNQESQIGDYKQIPTAHHSSLAPQTVIYYARKTEEKSNLATLIYHCEELYTDELYQFSSIFEMSLPETITFYIENIGNYEIEAVLQLSPDGIHFLNDSLKKGIIKANELIYIVPKKYAKYGRIAIRSIHPRQISKIRIWFQGQK